MLPNGTATRRRPATWRRLAFSLLEMMFVLVLIGILAGLVTLNARYYLTRGKQNAARGEIANICAALETYNSTAGSYPTSEEGLTVLSRKSDQFPEPLLTQAPRDPWGHAYQYNRPGRAGPYEVICFGADGREGGENADKDIGSWDLKESNKK